MVKRFWCRLTQVLWFSVYYMVNLLNVFLSKNGKNSLWGIFGLKTSSLFLLCYWQVYFFQALAEDLLPEDERLGTPNGNERITICGFVSHNVQIIQRGSACRGSALSCRSATVMEAVWGPAVVLHSWVIGKPPTCQTCSSDSNGDVCVSAGLQVVSEGPLTGVMWPAWLQHFR